MNEEPQTPKAHRRPNYLLVFLALAVITGVEVLFVSLFPGLPKAPFLLTMSLPSSKSPIRSVLSMPVTGLFSSCFTQAVCVSVRLQD